LSASAAIITESTFTLADRIKIQQQYIRERKYTRIGRLTTIVMERQLPTRGMSQSRPRYSDPRAAKMDLNDSLKPFSEWQMKTWASMTLDWLTHKNAPMLAVSLDRNDLLLPAGLTPLPKIPDPLWIPKRAGDVAPRVEQTLESRAYGQIKTKDGHRWLVFQPITELCLFLGQGNGGFGRIRGVTSPYDHTHLSLLVDPETMQGYFASGSFEAGF
jgi:hypothetical protein